MREGRGHLTKLTEAIRRIEGRQAVPGGWSPSADAAPASGQVTPPAEQWPPAVAMAPGTVHEWFAHVPGTAEATGAPASSPNSPPLCALLDLASRSLAGRSSRWAVWVGRWCWPYPPLLTSPGDHNPGSLHSRSLFVDPPDRQARLWAIEVAVRSPAVAVVVADGRSLSMAASQRLQLAAQASDALVLVARSGSEQKAISAAHARWRIAPTRSPDERPRWRIELVRCKGMQRWDGTDAVRTWHVEWDRAQGRVATPAELADPARATSQRRTA